MFFQLEAWWGPSAENSSLGVVGKDQHSARSVREGQVEVECVIDFQIKAYYGIVKRVCLCLLSMVVRFSLGGTRSHGEPVGREPFKSVLPYATLLNRLDQTQTL